ncbi:MAG: dihydroorotate dehydrogenase (quinone) [Deltaproteobacteria bacterium RIFCSPHIGHO2_02_FULL_40_11]|nr:MAG: dihydroorotate dehydrogenase (quinone) [Deltaproteobacteria bacterium RIFCSPHIGHO2_02_FULL_40_11]
MFYKLLRPILFLFDPEKIHDLLLTCLAIWHFFSINFRQKKCHVTGQVFGLHFPNPVGLAAGFDKNAKALLAWQDLGFGFIEIGTVTPKPQAGNPKPRIFRFPKEKALLNGMGFPNDGIEKVVERLKRAKPKLKIPVGLNIGKNKDTPNEKAVFDYTKCIEVANPYCDFFVLNVSSPNTEALRELQNEKYLPHLLEECVALSQRPVLLKLSPDLLEEELKTLLRISMEKKVSGFVVSNTTANYELLPNSKVGSGGISGKPLFQTSTAQLEFVKQHSNLPIIGCGGILSKEDAEQKRKAGADLIEIYTGLIYEGPGLVRRLVS